MIQNQIVARGIENPLILQAFMSIPRHCFIPEGFYSHAYDDTPIPIGYGQTISQPFTVALMTQYLEVEPGMRVLEIGSGSGYQAAILAAMGCIVIGIERLPEIYKNALLRIKKLNLESRIHLYRGDGTLGMPQIAPFERILVSAGGPEIPQPLISQLANTGILLIPIGQKHQMQRLIRVRKNMGKICTEDLGPVEFVDLIGYRGW